jgi:transcriptional regulator with XRE-family HTH domain
MTGKDIKAERAKRGIAQSALAKEAGMSRSVLIAIERGRLKVMPEELVRLWNLMDSIKPTDATEVPAA